MGRTPKDPNKVTVDKSQLDDIMARLDASEAKNRELAEKVAKSGKSGIETSAHRLLNRPQPPEQDMMKVQESITVVDELATKDGQMMRDACPFCKEFHTGQKTILDFEPKNGKYSCRRCGKHWELWMLKPSPITKKLYPYSLALEQGDKKAVQDQERIELAREGMPVSALQR